MYELLYIIPAKYTEDELPKITEKINEVIKSTGAEIKEGKNLGRIKFAYPIKKQTVGYYILSHFNMESVELKKLNRALQLEGEILRFMITKAGKPAKDVKISEYTKIDPTEKTRERRERVRPAVAKDKEKEKIKIEDIDKKLDTILEKEIV